MNMYRTLLAAVIAASFAGAPALADPPRESDRAFRDAQRGRALPLPMLERKVMPQMGGADYLGPELRGQNLRMKFMDNGRVIWVDVDPKTGQIVGKSGD
jgi:hypothetical protein